MLRRVGAFFFFAAVSATGVPAAGPDLPEIMAGPSNAVPQCVTPGRLMAFLKQRNPQINPRYDGIATQYMRFGEQLGVRWDYAFYQMVVETGALSYWRGNRHGDVRPEQNNFAGLGATGGGERGESFKDIESGVRAHIEHILLYAGHPVASPVAERTRKVHEWGILSAWQKSFRRPIGYGDLATKWAPGNRSYTGMLETVAERFMADVCRTPDPRPQLVQEARALIDGGATGNSAPGGSQVAEASTTPSVLALGKELMQRVFDPKADPNQGRSALGAPPGAEDPAASSAPLTAPYKILDPPPAETQAQPPSASQSPAATPARPAAADTGAPPAKSVAADTAARPAETKAGAAPARAGIGDKASARFALAGTAATAAAKAKALPDTALPPAASQKCRVWTASYGGQKSIIIRSIVDQVVNFTVLDVNSGQETREAEAFIAAYAKNGKIAGEYPNQAQALDKAFELCPEG